MRTDSQKEFMKQRRKWLKEQVKALNKETSESSIESKKEEDK